MLSQCWAATDALSDGFHVETDLRELLMVKELTSVKKESRLHHTVVDSSVVVRL